MVWITYIIHYTVCGGAQTLYAAGGQKFDVLFCGPSRFFFCESHIAINPFELINSFDVIA